jgi:hypothetical protein
MTVLLGPPVGMEESIGYGLQYTKTGRRKKEVHVFAMPLPFREDRVQ